MSEIRLIIKLLRAGLRWVISTASPSPPKAQTPLREVTEICQGYLRFYRKCTLGSLHNFNSEVLILKQTAPTQTSCPFSISLILPGRNKTESKPLIVSFKNDLCLKVTSESLSANNTSKSCHSRQQHDSLLPSPPTLDSALNLQVRLTCLGMPRMHKNTHFISTRCWIWNYRNV